MSYTASPQAPVVTLPEENRVAFMIKVYQHIGLAIAAFIGIEIVLFASGLAEKIYDLVSAGGGAVWLLVLGAFMLGSWMAAQATAIPKWGGY